MQYAEIASSLIWMLIIFFSYREEVLRRSQMLKDRRHSPVEEAVYWVEHSLKYPFSLTPKSLDLSVIQLHLVDINIFITLGLLTVLYIFYFISSIAKKIVLKAIRKPKQKVQWWKINQNYLLIIIVYILFNDIYS